MQEQFSCMKETYEGDIKRLREDKSRLETDVASLDKVSSWDLWVLLQWTVKRLTTGHIQIILNGIEIELFNGRKITCKYC